MLIIWGKKRASAHQGVIGRHCALCRTVRVHDVVAHSLVSHVYYMPLGQPEVQMIECTCRGCGMVYVDDEARSWGPDRTVEAFRLGVHAPLEQVCELAVATGAEDAESLLSRLQLEDRLRAGQVKEPRERFALIVEPIAATAYMTMVKPERSGQQSVTAVLQLLLIIGLVASALLWGTLYQQRTPRTAMDYSTAAAVTVATAVIAYNVVRRMLGAQRMGARAYVLGPLGRSLAAITPRVREEEVAEALEFLRGHGHPLTQVVSAGDVMLRVEEAWGQNGR